MCNLRVVSNRCSDAVYEYEYFKMDEYNTRYTRGAEEAGEIYDTRSV